MRRAFRFLPSLLFAVLAGMLPISCSAPPAADPPPKVVSLDGATVEPFMGRADSLVLLIFLVDGCPIANALSPEIARIGDEARARGAAVWLVYPDPHVDPATIKRRHREFAVELPTLLDPRHTTVRATGATISPEAALCGSTAQAGSTCSTEAGSTTSSRAPAAAVRQPERTTSAMPSTPRSRAGAPTPTAPRSLGASSNRSRKRPKTRVRGRNLSLIFAICGAWAVRCCTVM